MAEGLQAQTRKTITCGLLKRDSNRRLQGACGAGHSDDPSTCRTPTKESQDGRNIGARAGNAPAFPLPPIDDSDLCETGGRAPGESLYELRILLLYDFHQVTVKLFPPLRTNVGFLELGNLPQ